MDEKPPPLRWENYSAKSAAVSEAELIDRWRRAVAAMPVYDGPPIPKMVLVASILSQWFPDVVSPDIIIDMHPGEGM